MSLVISAGNSENLFLGGDGRLSDNDANGNFVILDEDVQKVHILSKYVAVGFAGHLSDCKEAMNKSCSMMLNLNLLQTADVFQNCCKSVLQSMDSSKNVQMIVAGKTQHQETAFYVIRRYLESFTYDPHLLANPSVYEFHGISGLDGDLNWIDAIMRSSLDMKSNIERAIREAARRSNTVNDRITMLSFDRINGWTRSV